MRPVPSANGKWPLGVVVRRSSELGSLWSEVERDRLRDTLVDVIPSTPVWIVNTQVPDYYGVITVRLKPAAEDVRGWIRRDLVMALNNTDQTIDDLRFDYCRDCRRGPHGLCANGLPHVDPGPLGGPQPPSSSLRYTR